MMKIDAASIARELARNGWVELGLFESDATRREMIGLIDDWADGQAEINYAGSEKRVWRAHEHNPAIARFRDFADETLSALSGKAVISRDILAIRNRPVAEDEALQRGRWHLDSLRRQIKVFLFLTDVTPASGPLELVPGSHRLSFKFRHALDGNLIRPTDFRGSTRRYQCLDDDWVSRRLDAVGGSHAFLCRGGTAFIVDTSAIHRARPCLSGERYALTAYYDHF